MNKGQTIHHRAWVNGWAVAYCKASDSPNAQPTTSPDPTRVNCKLCQGIRAGK